MSDVTAAIVFHGERLLVQASIASFAQCCDLAADRGIKVERIALVDRPDPVTLDAVQALRPAFDHVETLDHGDLGATRNAGIALATTRYVAFFDGDDLWGDEWIARAHRLAEDLADDDVVFHPRAIAYFSADDYVVQSRTAAPPAQARSYHLVQQDSRNPGFDPRSLVFYNIWTANTFGLRSLHKRFPYRLVDTTRGFGIEDWTWNLETLVNGIKHAVVPDTVHCIRMKPQGSLGRQFVVEGLIPPIHEFAAQLERAWDEGGQIASGPEPS